MQSLYHIAHDATAQPISCRSMLKPASIREGEVPTGRTRKKNLKSFGKVKGGCIIALAKSAVSLKGAFADEMKALMSIYISIVAK